MEESCFLEKMSSSVHRAPWELKDKPSFRSGAKWGGRLERTEETCFRQKIRLEAGYQTRCD